MAKPPVRKPKKKQNPLKAAKIDLRRLQGHRAAAQVHLRPGQDPRPPGDRCVRPAAARRSPRRSRTPARWRCCPTRAPRAEKEDETMKLILTQEVTGLGDPRRRRRGQGRLRPQLPGAARPGHRLDQGRREAGRLDPQGPRVAARSPTSRTRSGSSSASRAPPCGCRSTPARPAACSAPSRPPTSPTAVKAAGGTEVDRRKVEIGQPIKALGDHQVTVRLHPDVQATDRPRGRPGVVTPWTW